MEREPSPGPGISFRALRLAVVFALVAGTVVGSGIAWLQDARLGRPTLAFNYARMLGKRLPELAAARAAGQPSVGFVGDSSVVSYPAGRTLPERVQQASEGLQAGPRGIHVSSLAMPGAGPFDYYFLADQIAEARPDAVVIALNLDHFSRAWQGAYSRPQLAALIEPGRLGEALLLPLHWTGLTTDRLLFSMGLVQAGGYDPLYWLTLRQAQVGRARDRFERWLQSGDQPTPEQTFRDRVDEQTIARVFTSPDIRHYRRDALLEHYGESLAGLDPNQPVIRVLAATVARLREADIEVLVYLAPVEVSWLDAQGVLGREGFARTIAVVKQAVEASGGHFADLHAALPAEAFRDAPGHLAVPPPGEDGLDGPALLADLLAPLVVRRLD